MLTKLGMEYPPYYVPVFVEYAKHNSNIASVDILWLAVDDNGQRIWTLMYDNKTIIIDKNIDILDWWPIENNEDI